MENIPYEKIRATLFAHKKTLFITGLCTVLIAGNGQSAFCGTAPGKENNLECPEYYCERRNRNCKKTEWLFFFHRYERGTTAQTDQR